MKVLVTGASGLMGRALMREFERTPSCDVLGLAFSRAKGALRKVDIRDEREVRKVMQAFKDPKTMSGVFHWCGSEFMTKYTMITKIANAFDLPHDHLKPNPVQPTGGTLRPKDCSLDRSKLEALGIGQTTPIWEELQKVMAPFVTSQ